MGDVDRVYDDKTGRRWSVGEYEVSQVTPAMGWYALSRCGAGDDAEIHAEPVAVWAVIRRLDVNTRRFVAEVVGLVSDDGALWPADDHIAGFYGYAPREHLTPSMLVFADNGVGGDCGEPLFAPMEPGGALERRARG